MEQVCPGMFPFAALKMLICIVLSESWCNLKDVLIVRQSIYVLGLFDVRRAHWCAMARRKVYIELPEECGGSKCTAGL